MKIKIKANTKNINELCENVKVKSPYINKAPKVYRKSIIVIKGRYSMPYNKK